MEGYRVSANARQDIRDIVLYIAVDNKVAANRMSEAIFDTFSLLTTQPLMGKLSENLDISSVRYIPVKNYPSYLIFYQVEVTRKLVILRVLHGARDLLTLLNK